MERETFGRDPQVAPLDNPGEALSAIEAARARIHQTGNVDVEQAALNGIQESLKLGKISPQEALRRVEALEASRNER